MKRTELVENALIAIPCTTAALMTLIDRLFHCMKGPPMAYFELPLNWDEARTAGGVRFTYTTWWIAIQGDGDREVEAVLRAVWEEFKRYWLLLEARGYELPVLFWRAEPELEAGHNAETRTRNTKLRCRLCIPGVDLTQSRLHKHEGALGRYLTPPEVDALATPGVASAANNEGGSPDGR